MSRMIQAVHVNKTYRQARINVEAVKDVSLEIKSDESVLITGPSGAGKSTLLHVLGGLDRPTSGIVYFDGADFYSLSDTKRSRIRNEKIGFVFQFYHLLPEFTVLENVMLPALIRGERIRQRAADIRGNAEELLKLVGLKKRQDHRPSELSGGETQRVAIARSLINAPEILLCDEPTGNLDSKTGEEIIGHLWTLKENHDMTLVVVTHDEGISGDFDKRFRIKDGIIEKSSLDKLGTPRGRTRGIPSGTEGQITNNPPLAGEFVNGQ